MLLHDRGLDHGNPKRRKRGFYDVPWKRMNNSPSHVKEERHDVVLPTPVYLSQACLQCQLFIVVLWDTLAKKQPGASDNN